MAIDVAELRNLPPNEKLNLINLLWDDLRESGIPKLPPEELEEIERRYQRMIDHPEEALTIEQMWARVDELRK